MSLLVVVNQGKLAALANLVAGVLAGARALLFTSNVVPSSLTVIGDLVEPVFAGYARQLLAGWTVPALASDGSGVTSANTVSWLKTDAGAVSVYGFAIVTMGGALWAAARFDRPPLVVSQLVPFPLSVTVTDQSLA